MRSWIFNHIDFSTYPYYNGDDLGVFWTPRATFVKIWAPTAMKVEIKLYRKVKDSTPFFTEELIASENGTWKTTLHGNFEGLFYKIRVNDGEWLNEIPDIYARCVGANGKKGMIFDPEKTNPENWQNDRHITLNNLVDAIIYELHVRDFSISESSGMSNKGKFLAFTENNTFSPEGFKTGLAHLKELGVTHVHFLPIFDFFTVDEENPSLKYNWGYDPQNFNAVEGSFSSNPHDGRVRIKELKQLIKSLHDNKIGVVMDVVYNHTGLIKFSVFNQTVPGYFYRQNPDGTFADASGCGNEVATERAMVRKYIIDSLKYWAKEFHIDGFRFDLMGIYDLETMRQIEQQLKRINPNILLYGEGWTADSSPMKKKHRAVKTNTPKLSGIASFNDDTRNALKGGWNSKKSRGFISGETLNEEAVKFGIIGATYHPQIVYDYIKSSNSAWAADPSQCVNYITCHDNHTLWDKLKFSLPNASTDELKRRVKLAAAVILTSQGVPFIHAGMEFCRTKNGVSNSYKSPDSINQLDWSRKATHFDVFDYVKKLIQLRKNHPAFRIQLSEELRKNIVFCMKYRIGVVSYCIEGINVGDRWKKIFVVFNGNSHSVDISIPENNYLIIARGEVINESGIELFKKQLHFG